MINSFKRSRLLLAAVLQLLLLTGCSDARVVGLLEDDLSPRIEAARTGIAEVLREKGYKGAENVRYVRKNAESRKLPLSGLAASLFRSDKAEVVVVFSSQGVTAALAAAQGKPVVYLAASEPTPSGTGFFALLAPSPGSLSAEMARKFKPEVAEMGIVYDASEPASIASATSAQLAAQRLGLVATMLPLTIDGGAPSKPLSQRVVFLAWAPTMSDATIKQIFETTGALNVPVLTDKADLVSRGAVVAYEVDWKALGREAGELVATILNGGTPQSVRVDGAVKLTVNGKAAQALGITLPTDIASNDKVVH